MMRRGGGTRTQVVAAVETGVETMITDSDADVGGGRL